MRRTLVLAALLLMVGATTASAAHVVRYVSKHPLPKKIGRGFCYITVPHVHDYEPSDPRLYRQMDGQNYFVGDPAPFDYEGPRYSYYGAHPIADVNVHFGSPTYCYLRGPHYHWYSPPPQMQFELKGGAYWFVGNYEPVYYSERPRYVVINDVYAPVVYTRPVVDIRVAPPAFHGEIVAVGPGIGARAIVGGPVVSGGVYVAAPPPPVVHVGVGVGVGVGMVGAARRRPAPRQRPPQRLVQERARRAAAAAGRLAGRAPARATAGWRGTPPPPSGGGWRGSPGGPPPAAHGGGFRGRRAGALAAVSAARPAGTRSRGGGDAATRAGRDRGRRHRHLRIVGGRVQQERGRGGRWPSAAGPAAPQHVDGTPHTDAAIKAWQGAGLSPEGFAALTPVPFGAAYCEQGRVQAIDTLVCEYRDQNALNQGKTELIAQWEREGVNTGVAYQTKLTLLGVLDRGRRDPNGKVVSQVVDAFRKL